VIEPLALMAAKAYLFAMGQSRRGVKRMMEAQAHPLIMATPRFIQLSLPLPPLKPMVQSWLGVIRIVEA
jgi:hypothetical protein